MTIPLIWSVCTEKLEHVKIGLLCRRPFYVRCSAAPVVGCRCFHSKTPSRNVSVCEAVFHCNRSLGNSGERIHMLRKVGIPLWHCPTLITSFAIVVQVSLRIACENPLSRLWGNYDSSDWNTYTATVRDYNGKAWVRIAELWLSVCLSACLLSGLNVWLLCRVYRVEW